MNALAATVVIHRVILRDTLVPTPFRIHPVARSVALFGNLQASIATLHIISHTGHALVATFMRLRLATAAVANFVAGNALAATLAKILVVLAHAYFAAFSRPQFATLTPAGQAGGDALSVAFEKALVLLC